MKRINTILVALISYFFSFANAMAYISSPLNDIDLPEFDKQKDVITTDKHYFGDNDLTYLQGRSIRACIAWLQEWNDSVDVEVFSFLPEALHIKTWHEIPLDKQKDDIDRQEMEFQKYSFSIFPEYQNCNIRDLLNSGKILMDVKTSLPYPGNLVVTLKVLVNKANSKKLETNCSNTNELEFCYFKISYSYELDIISSDTTQESIDKAIKSFEFDLEFYYSEYYKELLKHPRGKCNDRSRLLKHFRWVISKIRIERKATIKFSNDDIPENLIKIFPY